MSNESLFVLSALIDILFISFAARRGADWLFGTVIINLVLVGVLGSKLITVFGLTTNAGNAFYACVFLATHFLIERHGARAGMKTIWFGASFVVFFAVMAQLVIKLAGLSLSDPSNAALSTLFGFSVRITVASLLGYIFAQYINVWVYGWLRAKTDGKYLWLRSNGANIISQLADSMVFFSIAFFDLPGPILLQAICVGWLVKTLVVLAGTPFLYADGYLERKKS